MSFRQLKLQIWKGELSKVEEETWEATMVNGKGRKRGRKVGIMIVVKVR